MLQYSIFFSASSYSRAIQLKLGTSVHGTKPAYVRTYVKQGKRCHREKLVDHSESWQLATVQPVSRTSMFCCCCQITFLFIGLVKRQEKEEKEEEEEGRSYRGPYAACREGEICCSSYKFSMDIWQAEQYLEQPSIWGNKAMVFCSYYEYY